MSGGQLQRVVLARALIINPLFVVADEPVSMLDVSVRAGILNAFNEAKKKINFTAIYISHDLALVKYVCDRTIVMYLGNIVEMGNSAEVYHHPRHPYSRALLSSVPLPDPSQKDRKRIVLKGDIPTPINKPSGCAFRTRCPIAKPECSDDIPSLVDTDNEHWVASPYWEEEF